MTICCLSPCIVLLAESLAVPYKAGVGLVKEHLALAASQARRVPLQVRRHAKDELVVDLPAAAHADSVLPHAC